MTDEEYLRACGWTPRRVFRWQGRHVMVEGDPKIVEWQVWDERDVEPSLPDGLVAGGPWFPFGLAYGVIDSRDGPRIHTVTMYRRPLVRIADAAKGDV